MVSQYAMTFADAFKKGFLENFREISFQQGALMMLVSVLLGLLICLIYRFSYRGVMYSHSFCVSLLAMDVITTLIILTVSSSIVISLGMVGALSIVRFRTAIKDPMDIAFLYFSIAAGIMCGANLLWLAILGVALVGVIILIASRLPSAGDAYILMINVEAEDEEAVVKYVMKSTKKCSLKSKALIGNTSELAMEVSLISGSTKFLNKLKAYPTISSITLVKSTGEYI